MRLFNVFYAQKSPICLKKGLCTEIKRPRVFAFKNSGSLAVGEANGSEAAFKMKGVPVAGKDAANGGDVKAIESIH